MLVSRIGHVGIEVRDLAKVRPFYDALAAGLGLDVVYESKKTIGYGNKNYDLWLAASDTRRVEKRRPTGDEEVIAEHLAIWVGGKAEVDRVAQVMGERGIRPLFPPQECPQFAKGYYAASFCDPENYVVEIYTV
jgi:catechol 2,3-dioxygenase-like lactoylglutathione lyase family enzyme